MSLERFAVIVARLILTSIACFCLVGCRTSEKRGDITSPYPLERVRAAVTCAEAGDGEAVDLLIEMLDDSDRGVRMYSILALKRLCGVDYGYSYYASDAKRAEALERWRAARRRGEVRLAPAVDDADETMTAAAQIGEVADTP